jgi:hypothetical protein
MRGKPRRESTGWRTHLGALDRAMGAKEGGRRRDAARWRKRAIARARRQSREREKASGDAYHCAKLLRRLLDGRR